MAFRAAENTSKIQDLAANFTAAVKLLVSLAYSYIDDAEKVFENENFLSLFQSLTLDKVRMTTPRWKCFLGAILDNEAFEDRELLPSLLFIAYFISFFSSLPSTFWVSDLSVFQ